VNAGTYKRSLAHIRSRIGTFNASIWMYNGGQDQSIKEDGLVIKHRLSFRLGNL
jgi:hypothetical protein